MKTSLIVLVCKKNPTVARTRGNFTRVPPLPLNFSRGAIVPIVITASARSDKRADWTADIGRDTTVAF